MDPQQVLQDIGDYFSNESVRIGAAVVGTTALTVVATGWRWLRPRPEKPQAPQAHPGGLTINGNNNTVYHRNADE